MRKEVAMGLFKQRVDELESRAEDFNVKVAQTAVSKLIENHYKGIGITEDRVKFMQNKWNTIVSGDAVEFCEPDLIIKVSPSTMQEDSISVCRQLGVKTSDYKSIWQATKVVSKYLRNNANNYEINSVGIEGMGIAIVITSDAVSVKYKGIVFTFKEGRTIINKHSELLKRVGSLKQNLDLFNLDKAMIGVLGALCETKTFIEDTEKWS